MEVLLFAVLAIIVGLGLSFMGYAAFRILLPILAFLAGLWLGMDIVKEFALNYPLMGISLGLILGLVLGGIFAAVAYLVYSLAVVIFGISLGYALGAGFMYAIGLQTPFINFIVGVVLAVAIGVAFMKTDMPKLYIMGLTAFAGASAIIAGVLALFGVIPPSSLGLAVIGPYISQSWFLIIVWAVLGAGFLSSISDGTNVSDISSRSLFVRCYEKELEQKAKKS